MLFARLESDMRQAIPRSARMGTNAEPAWLALPADSLGNSALTFTRAGPEFAVEPGIAGQRIGYRLRDGAIEALYWPQLDNVPGATPIAYVLARASIASHRAAHVEKRLVAAMAAAGRNQRPACSVNRSRTCRRHDDRAADCIAMISYKWRGAHHRDGDCRAGRDGRDVARREPAAVRVDDNRRDQCRRGVAAGVQWARFCSRRAHTNIDTLAEPWAFPLRDAVENGSSRRIIDVQGS
jgi:hypothetical protein